MNKIDLSNTQAIIEKHLLELQLTGYKRKNDKISEMVRSGELIPLVRAKYISGEAYETGKISTFLIANGLYGPSYISGFTALYYYGWIPEKVVSIESVTTKRSRKFETPIGRFEYKKVAVNSFHVGISYKLQGEIGFLIACPTKALVDVLWTENVAHITSLKTLDAYLFENLRIDESEFVTADEQILNQCIQVGRKKRLLKLLKKLLISYQYDLA